ncbi:thiol:disulfide interchange protein DsbA/DsbL [Polynucleobacter paneuropaeus]|jgi:thiol:disulfide interchange protein DsbA|uniref:thiol:disulfide interchange protein DsbA/DsbL n=1 Tax=Polynucleobacter paneuropaeus TaxID=2527775 RepID=UPI000DBF30E1|nr:thiol:disulfide interchange protein DsbA/DsbL [Polynucleobacter paneuropaeus]AWW45109.1 thiol:disulfide interchange protein DsbA/DsbL [Polynucleobacter paneuropaeus]MBT8526357.1 thiol:disulfide interchange protein DsbA/DsbL [Polynucleobacter paneuropaeus]MBT8533019.1 thiol:disulfide interchange protein DsbA/DsbL [Polynucleobacter paneuropaeus]MBT8537581.1 thiol:disulfide interchange protein DsbA/DsbL [Polynucleobacter paneuropaeus]MBT8558632.1 thiol:disulfide interchange protein DsbA/DsbL [
MTTLTKRAILFISCVLLAGVVNAQGSTPSGKIEEGFEYRVLPTAQPVEIKGKVEVIEFFWYGCPHCYDFEPDLSAWVKSQPKDVAFRRVPVAFRDDFLPHSQLYYALLAMGKADALNDKVFYAIHKENKRLLTENDIADWVASQGVDRNAFLTTYRSFAVISKARAANQLVMQYHIDGVPTIVMQGRYLTSPSIAGSKAKAIEVMTFLEDKIRKDRYK